MATSSQALYGSLLTGGIASPPEAGYDPTGSENVTDYESSTYVDPSLVTSTHASPTGSSATSTAATSAASSVASFLEGTVMGLPMWMVLAAGAGLVWYFSERRR